MTLQERPSHSQNYGEYEFCFEDNGIGMSEEFQRVLFEPFTRAEDSRLSKVTGTGLGMTITRNLIRMMDGDIRVESELGKRIEICCDDSSENSGGRCGTAGKSLESSGSRSG